MVRNGPLPGVDDACVVCPARKLAAGAFDVVDAAPRDYQLNKKLGYRADKNGTPVCVHPYRLGLQPGRYASGNAGVPDKSAPAPAPSKKALQLPDNVDDLDALDAWLIAILRTATDAQLNDEIARAEKAAGKRFAPDAVTDALRRVLGKELARRG